MPTYQLLTDRTLAESTAITPTTLIHIVTTADTRQNSAGSSYKAELQQLSSLFSNSTFSGGSGNCIADLYVTNIHGCSPITIYDSIKSTGSTVSGLTSFSFGYETSATTDYSFAIGEQTLASGTSSHSEGWLTNSSGSYSHAEGQLTLSLGQSSHAEGQQTISSGSWSHSEGTSTIASGDWSHAEGNTTIASGDFSHAEGFGTLADGKGSHAEGGYFLHPTYVSGGTALGRASHAEGIKTTAYGIASHAEGDQTYSFGFGSHAEGQGTYTSGTYQHATGKWNLTANTTSGAFIIGNGTSNLNRSNLLLAAGSGVTVYGNFTADTISATTYYNLPLGNYGTGLTFNTGTYDLSLDGGNGVLDTISLSVLSSDMTVTGGTYNPVTGTATFTNNSGGTFPVTGFLVGYTDTLVTGATYSNNTFTFRNSTGGTFNVLFNTVTGLTSTGNISVGGNIVITGSVIPNVSLTATTSTITPTYGTDLIHITGLTAGLTINAPTGPWPDGKDLTIRIKDNGVARTISWNAIYRSIGVTLPNITVPTKTTYVGIIYNQTDNKFDVIGSTTEL